MLSPDSLNRAPVQGAFRVHGAELDLVPGARTPANSGAGETWHYRWSIYRTRLTLRRAGHRDQPTALVAVPFDRS